MVFYLISTLFIAYFNMSELKEYLSKKNISYNNLVEYCSLGILKQKCPELSFSYNEQSFIIYANFTSEIAYVFKIN